MFKFLPEQSRKKMEHEYLYRKGIIFVFGLSLVALVGIVALVPSFILAKAHLGAAKESLRALAGKEEGDYRMWLQATNEKVRIVSQDIEKEGPHEYIEKITALKPKEVSLTSFVWRIEDNKIVITIRGVATTRNTLLAFENRLNTSGTFSKAVLPVSNFAKDRNIEFELTVSPTSYVEQ